MNKQLPLFCLLMILSSCSLFRPYQIEIQQGRPITREQMQQVKPEMTQDAVTYLLGTPDFIDPYFPDTWYYVYTNQKDYLPRAQNKLVLHFKGGKVVKIEGDYPPPARLEYETYEGQ